MKPLRASRWYAGQHLIPIDVWYPVAQQAELTYAYGLTFTAFVAEPPRLLRTVMFCGFVGHANFPL
jgi:hypothetical protein